MGIHGKKPEDWSCEICKLAKSYKQISRDTPFRSVEACAELHTDTIPVKPQGLGGFNHFMTIIDSATMYTWVVFLVQKSEAGQKLQDFIRWLEKQSGRSVKMIMRDGGREYSPTEEKLFARETGIDVRESAPRTPEQNGKAEVTGRYILEMARAARINAGLPEFLWPQAITHAVEVRNLTPKRKLAWKSPYEVFGRALGLPDKSVIPDIKHIRVFGCEAYVRIPEEDPDFIKARKTRERSHKGAFVGTEGTHGHIFVVWIPEKKRLFRSRDVEFREVPKNISEEMSEGISQKEEDKTYRVVIRQEEKKAQRDLTDQTKKPTASEVETSAESAGHRYGTPESIEESVGCDPESEHEIWYPADIIPVVSQQDVEPVVSRSADQSESSNIRDKKPAAKETRESTDEPEVRVSARKNKGQRNDQFEKQHFVTYVAFVAAQISNYFIPKTLKEALTGPDKEHWMEACRKQLAKIEKKGTWELCDLPRGHKAIPTKWVFDPKLRARLVACGNFEKKADVETFAAVVNMTMVKIFLTVVAILGLECYQFDFEGAFLNGNMDQRLVFVRQPPGFGDGTNRVYKLLKTLYGLRDSPLAWFREATKLMRKAGFEPLASEACVFVNKDKSVWIILYVDDMAIAAATKDLIDTVASQLGSVFTLTPLGEIKTFLGVQIIRDRKLRTISINQEPYIDRVLGRKGWTNLKGVGSPLDVHIKTHTSMEKLDNSDKEEYLELVGSAQWIGNNTRPDVTYAVNFLGRHREQPTRQHLYQIKRVWRYLSGTKKLGLILGGERNLQDLDLWLHCDASWADDPTTRRTIAGHIVYIGNSPIKWQSKQQSLVTLSTTEAEFVNMSTAGRDMLWIKRLLRDINIPVLKVPVIGTDSMNALRAAESPQENMSTRHIDVRYKWVKEKVKNGELTLDWVDTTNMKADGLTKALNPTKQAQFVKIIGLTEIFNGEPHSEVSRDWHSENSDFASEDEKEHDNPEFNTTGNTV